MDYQCSCCEKNTSGKRKSSITNFPSFMCILLCHTISSAAQFPALAFDLKGDHMPYDLSATVHHKPTKGGNGHYTAISRSRNLQSQEWFMYDDDRVSSSKFTKTHKKHIMVKKSYTKTATILFYISPSIETRIKNAKTIGLMEEGKEEGAGTSCTQLGD